MMFKMTFQSVRQSTCFISGESDDDSDTGDESDEDGEKDSGDDNPDGSSDEEVGELQVHPGVKVTLGGQH